MNKTLKTILIIVISVAGGIALLWGGLTAYKHFSRGKVSVYSVSDFSMTEYWEDSSETYGNVRADDLQNVYISTTQTVKEVYVAEGDEVNEGDALLAYDTTLSDIDLEKAQIALEKLQLELDDKQKELTEIKRMTPHYSKLITPEQVEIEYKSLDTPCYITGDGTEESPAFWLISEDDMIDEEFLASVFESYEEVEELDEASIEYEEFNAGDHEEEPDEVRDYYLGFAIKDYNAINGELLYSYGIHAVDDNGSISFSVYDAVVPEELLYVEVQPEPYYEEGGSDYTAAEIASMRNECEIAIRDLQVDIEMSKVELERLTKEVTDGVVRATISGTVVTLNDETTVNETGDPLLTVSAGGGYYVEVGLSEAQLGLVNIGDTVTVSSWETGDVVDGSIVEISEYPIENYQDYYGSSGTNSYYPFTVFIPAEANLREGTYVSVQYSAADISDDAFYVETMFIRSENGKSYVLAEGADGLLEKRYVTTGKVIWGEYTQIKSGITLEDYVAFPYGEAEEGMAVEEASTEEFYSSIY